MQIKAFVSSTADDLLAHRKHVIGQLRKSGINVDSMEDWQSVDKAPKTFSTERVEDCDLFVLLVARRRGTIPDGGTESITQMEYDYAKKKGIYVLVFLLRDDSAWFAEHDERSKDPNVAAWRNYLLDQHGASWFGLQADSLDVLPAVTRWVTGRKHHYESLWPTVADIELVTQSFFESSFPAYVLDTLQRTVAWNTSFRVLVGQRGPTRFQHIKDWQELYGHQVTTLSNPQERAPSIERAVLVLHTESFGRMQFDQLTTPVIDPKSSDTKYYTAALSPSGTDPEVVARFLAAVQDRLARQLFWTQYAVAYDKVLLPYSGYQDLIKLHSETIRNAPCGKVLDLGAGTGNIAFQILNLYPNRFVTAIDSNQSMLYQLTSKCRRFEDRLEIRFDDVEDVPDVTPEVFAAVVMNNVMMFLKEPQSILKSVCTCLITDGLLSLHVPNQGSSVETLLSNIRSEWEKSGRFSSIKKEFEILASYNRSMDSGDRKLGRFSAEELSRLLNEAGFTVDRVQEGTYAGQGIYVLARKQGSRL